MKKNLFLAVAAASTLALGSCSNDDDNNDDATIVGVWKYTQMRVISGKDNSTILSNNTLDDCEKKQTIEFTTDGKAKVNYYEFYNGTCNHSPEEIMTYTYNKTTKILVIDGVESHQIKSLTKNEFVVIDPDMVSEDFNNDGYDDIYELHLTK